MIEASDPHQFLAEGSAWPTIGEKTRTQVSLHVGWPTRKNGYPHQSSSIGITPEIREGTNLFIRLGMRGNGGPESPHSCSLVRIQETISHCKNVYLCFTGVWQSLVPCNKKPLNKYTRVTLTRLFYNILWQLWVGICRLGLFARDISFDTLCLGTACGREPSFAKFRLGSTVSRPSFGGHRQRTVAWDRSLGTVCFEPFVSEPRVDISAWFWVGSFNWDFFAGQPSLFNYHLGICCLRALVWDRLLSQRSLGIFDMGVPARFIPLVLVVQALGNFRLATPAWQLSLGTVCRSRFFEIFGM